MLAVSRAIPVEAPLDPPLQAAVDARLRRMDEDGVVGRMWARDHTVWREDPTEIADRLGWLTAPHYSRALVPEVRALAEEAAAEGLTHAVLMGMGGSSLAPEVLRAALGAGSGGVDLRVLDSTHPGAIAAIEAEVPLDRALFVVSSKSGTTIETRSHMAYFLDRVGEPRRFVAVTDAGTPLEADAEAAGFRAVVRAAPDVGGRYSALTAFGLLPAALIGADVEALLESGAEASAACGGSVGIHANPGAVAGAILGEAAAAGRDKLTLRIADPVAALGAWIEQLVAESTGKDGTGIIPVADEPGDPGTAPDRLFLALGDETPPEPWVRLPLGALGDLGAAFFVLELATAVAGHVLGIHPFDQPDVQAAKDRTEEVLAAGEIPLEPPGDLDELLGSVRPGDYVAIQAFVGPDPGLGQRLRAARGLIGAALGVATTLGYGPRYLHSAGQLHKGGPASGVFVQVVEEPEEDRPIPGRPFTFGRLIAAQAAGDLAALRERGRRAARVPLEDLVAWTG
jgi:transaldolase/glucose-6-phosphate isomerase